MRASTVFMAIALILGLVPLALASNLWQDEFEDGSLDAGYVFSDGGNGVGPPQWVE